MRFDASTIRQVQIPLLGADSADFRNEFWLHPLQKSYSRRGANAIRRQKPSGTHGFGRCYREKVRNFKREGELL